MSDKRGGLGCTGCFFVVCVLVAGVLILLPPLERRQQKPSAVSPQPPSPPGPPPPTTLRPRPPRRAKALRQFQRVDLGREAQLGWGFVDYERRAHQVWCRVDLSAHAAEARRFGYVAEEAQAEVARRVAPLVRAAVAARGYGGSVTVSPDGPRIRWRVAPQPDMERAMAIIKSTVDDVWARHEPRISSEVYAETGFILDGDTLRIDYAGLAARASPLLEGCAQALVGSGAGYDLGQYLGLFVAFFQEIPYELPPDHEGRKSTGGFWVPTEVLVGNHGDCDSKSAAFCALWRRLGTPVLIVQLPKHVLVGVAVPPRPGQQWIRMGSRTYVLCEVAGPGRRRPGARRPISGHFRYTVVEPTREGFAVTRGDT